MYGNNFIEINLSNIINNIIKIRKNIYKDSKLYIVAKSDFYGLGLATITMLEKYIDGVVIADFNEFIQVKNDFKKKIIILYPNMNEFLLKEFEENNNIYLTLVCEKDFHLLDKQYFTRIYLRIDPFLGGHGVNFNTAKNLYKRYKFFGVLIHINEYLTSEEEIELVAIIEWANSLKLKINIGGSSIINSKKLLGTELELRFTKVILQPSKKKETISLNSRILIKNKISTPISIGYKSDRIKILKGTILTVGIGYGDFGFLPYFYENKIPIIIEGVKFFLPCYPCMNTFWLHTDFDVNIKTKYITIFDNMNDEMLLKLELDEILTSFSKSIEKKYTN